MQCMWRKELIFIYPSLDRCKPVQIWASLETNQANFNWTNNHLEKYPNGQEMHLWQYYLSSDLIL